MAPTPADQHPFVLNPQRTMLALSVPVLFSMIAEPLTGLVDTAFIAALGATETAALGVGVTALSSVFWLFNFLGISIQTELAKGYGNHDLRDGAQMLSLALTVAVVLSTVLMLLMVPFAAVVASALGADDSVLRLATDYIRIRVLGTPAVLLMFVGFGALRGLQDMRTPLYIAVSVNAMNIVLDALLIHGALFIPPLDIQGAALASTISQWFGAGWVLVVLLRRIGLTPHLQWGQLYRLLRMGRDLTIRTGLLTVFLIVTTRVATQLGDNEGAAHQAIRQVWTFGALFMDAFAVTAQSLVGYFVGAARKDIARRAATVSTSWTVAAGVGLMVAMLLSTELVIALLVPDSAVDVFRSAWIISAVVQPINALAFATDGIHWGTGDFQYLRNAMLLATAVGIAGVLLIDQSDSGAFDALWIMTGVWIVVRAGLGVARVYPGFGNSPLKMGAA